MDGFTPDDQGPDDEKPDETPPAETLPAGQESIDPALAREARDHLRRIVRGNGLKPDAIALKTHQAAVISFEAYGIFRIAPVISEKQVHGRETGEVAGTREAARQKLQAAIAKLGGNHDVHKLTTTKLKRRADMGFMVTGVTVPLERLGEKIIVHEGCTVCDTRGKILCQNCQGKQHIPCTRCHGHAEIQCPVCHGAQTVNGPKGPQTCTQCQGRGRIGCDMCRRTGEINCPKCQTSGRMPCSSCSATGWQSHIFLLQVQAEGRFDYQREAVPEKLAALIDGQGPAILTEGHLQARLMDDLKREQEINKHSKADEFIIPYQAQIPWGPITFSIGNKDLTATLCGFQPVLRDLPPLLEKTAGKGLAALKKAARAQGGVAGHINTAIRYRLIGETFTYTLRLSPARALAALRKKYPYGIRTATLKSAVSDARQALNHLTRKPRLTGLAAGAALTAVAGTLYYFGPLGAAVPASIPAPAADLLLGLGGGLITTTTIQLLTGQALKKALGQLARQGGKNTSRPQWTQSALWGLPAGIGVIALLWLAAGGLPL